MPFDFDEYRSRIKNLSLPQLQKEWEKYVRQIWGATAGAVIGAGLIPATGGLSAAGVAASGAQYGNALKKIDILQKEFNARGEQPKDRKRDVFLPLAIGGATAHVGHLAGPALDHVANQAACHGHMALANHQHALGFAEKHIGTVARTGLNSGANAAMKKV